MQQYCACGEKYILIDDDDDDLCWECEDEDCEEPAPLCIDGEVVVRKCNHEDCRDIFKPENSKQMLCAMHQGKKRSSGIAGKFKRGSSKKLNRINSKR